MPPPGNSRLHLLVLLMVAVITFTSNVVRTSDAQQPGDDAARATTETAPQEKAPPPRTSSDLPWLKKKSNTDSLPILRPPANVREIMEKYDIGDSQLEGFFAGQPVSPGEEDVLIRILYRLPRIGLENIQKWRKPELKLEQLVADPSPHRLEVIPLEGRLIGIEKRDLAPELAARLEFKQYYLATIQLTDLDYQAIVAVRRVPQFWLDAPALDEPVNLDGMYLKTLGDISEPQLLFVARRIQWRPDRAIPELDIGDDQLRLAELGFDLSLLEDLKQSNRRELNDLDREPQYQLLDLVGRVPGTKLIPKPPKEVDVVALLKEPEKHHGELLTVNGFAQRITKIVVEDPDIRARFGITHYYEIDVGVNLGDKTIRIVDSPKGKKPAAPSKPNADKAQDKTPSDKTGTEEQVFSNDFPVTICVRELAPGLEPADHMRERVQVHGIFMKTWAYRSQQLARTPNKLQVAPLIVGKIAQRVAIEKVYNWVADTLVGFALAAAAIIVGSVIWWFRGSEKIHRDQTKQSADADVQPSFAGLENAPTRPDFSGIEKSSPDTNTGPSPPR